MQINEFKGIQQYHDGRPVSDYCNMIPLETSVIDRHGEKIYAGVIEDLSDVDKTTLETFVDSTGRVYVANKRDVYELVHTRGGGELVPLGVPGYEPTDNVTFCESSTKPSQVFCCDGHNVWYWNTQRIDIAEEHIDQQQRERYIALFPKRLPLFTLDKDDDWKSGAIAKLEDGKVPVYYGWPDAENFDQSKRIEVTSISWFDNRLVLVQKSKNTVWLSEVDPSRWLVPTSASGDGAWYPLWPWQPQDSEALDTPINTFIPHYYASTASAANIQDAIAFAGQLYFLNDTSIEVWSATGNTSNPIQHNSQNTLYFGGRSPVIVDDTLYLICKGAIHNDFIAAIGQNGAIQKVSNDEIERNLVNAYRIRPLAVRDQSMIVVYSGSDYSNGYALTKTGLWWRYWNDKHEAIAWSVVNRDGVQFGVSKYSRILIATEENRKYANGMPILREITGGFMQFVGRKILREVEVVCDTGVYLDVTDDRMKYFLRVSFDRGLNYGPFLYRAAGASGKNNRVILWRNCGSGNSVLLQFGTSDNMRFQIFGLRFELN